MQPIHVLGVTAVPTVWSTIICHAPTQVLYPAMRQLMGPEAEQRCLDEHQQIKNVLAQLDNLTVEKPEFMNAYNQAMQVGRPGRLMGQAALVHARPYLDCPPNRPRTT